jgi:hypothetical protein
MMTMSSGRRRTTSFRETGSRLRREDDLDAGKALTGESDARVGAAIVDEPNRARRSELGRGGCRGNRTWAESLQSLVEATNRPCITMTHPYSETRASGIPSCRAFL